MNILRIFMACAMAFNFITLSAQITDNQIIATDFMKTQVLEEGYIPSDFAEYEVIHSFKSANNGVTHIYIVQKYQGVEIENAIFNVNILPDGTVFHHGNSGVKEIKDKVTKIIPSVGCHEAFGTCLTEIGLSSNSLKQVYQKTNEIRFAKTEGLFDDVLVRKLWAKQADGLYRLVWDMNVLTTTTQEAINYQVDVATGKIIRKKDITIKCQFDHKDHDNTCTTSVVKTDRTNELSRRHFPIKTFDAMMDNAQYNVFPIPGESPNHVSRTLVTNVADPVASPFGWHDNDGVVGPEFTNTSGNNVLAAADFDGDDVSDGMEPNGGASLIFDFPINLNAEPKSYTDAATVNLFYMNNIMHDIAFRYGFDEAAGNFQTKNYSGIGNGADLVDAFAQSNIDVEASSTTRNNANFSPSAEGFKGRMRMYVWERGFGGADLLEILSPASISGNKIRGNVASFGPELPAGGVSQSVVQAISGNNNLACSALNNASAIKDRIALIDRGVCNFDLKVQNAKNAGAIAVIVCNFEEETFAMGGTIDSGIPSIMIGNQDCLVLKAALSEGLQVRLSLPPVTGPDQVDGTLDNGIVAHEYGHGISSRLVGGSQRAGCLSNDQQMGEGWSDFFTLILSVEPGDDGATPRGIGTFVQRDDTDGLGIRRFPYSTDMTVNPLTLGDVVLTGGSPHNLGAVWCSMIWDLYWALAERDGFDPDVYEGTGGNNTAIQLVMDGMKMLGCSPSFTEAREAILAADVANNGGANQGLIWKVFARRGLGSSAQGGNSDDRTQLLEAFDIPGEFDPGLKITKTMTELINPGDEVTVNIEVKNDKSTILTNITVTDIIPANATFITNSASQTVSKNGDQLTFNLGILNPTQTKTLSYKLNTIDDNFSDLIWYDGIEEWTGKWVEEVKEGKEGWNLTGSLSKSGNSSFFIKNDTVTTDRAIRNATPIDLTGISFPVLRYYHLIKSERGYDAGIVELSRDGGSTWEDAGDRIYKNGYTGKIPYQPFALANQRGYYGNSINFLESYIDLRDFIGDDLHFRFRFGSDNETVVEGWYMDDVSVFDMKTYQSQACASSDEGDNVCAEAPYFGTVINYDLSLDTNDPDLREIAAVELYPNPTKEWINITITGKQISKAVDYKVFNVSGKYMSSGILSTSNGNVNQAIDVSALPTGMYFVNFTVGDEQVSKRFIKQ